MSQQEVNIVNLENSLENVNELNDFPVFLREALNAIIRREGYVSCKIIKRMVSTKGGNFMGILYEVDIKGTTEEGYKETNLFVKLATVLKKIRIVSIQNLYSNEVYVYNELAKIFSLLQNEANISQENIYKMAKGYMESSDRVIIMENLAKRGYKISNSINISLKFAELSVEQLAKFHGLFFVIQKRMPDFYKMTIKNKIHPAQFDADWKDFITKLCSKVIEDLDSNAQDKVKKFVPRFLNNYQQYLSDNAQINVLCHGDYKANNIMVKEINGEIVEVMPMDYQMIYHGCPVTDFLYFMFTSTDQQFRRDHLEHLKCLYHESLRRYLEHFNMDVELIFPRKQFEQIYKERLEFGLMAGLYVCFFVFVPENKLPDLENQAMSELVLNLDERYENFVRGLIDDFIQWGYL